MRSNEDIIYDYERVNVDHKEYLLTKVDCLDAMKEAQTEILKEAVKRYRMQSHPIYEGQGKFKTVDDIVLELIKEIES